MQTATNVARWESKGKAYIQLVKDILKGRSYSEYSYGGSYGGGFIGIYNSDEEAIKRMEDTVIPIFRLDYTSAKRVE